MKKYNIYYYHPLSLTFKSAQTLQIVRDYAYLAHRGYQVFLNGYIVNESDLISILQYSKNNTLHVKVRGIGIYRTIRYVFYELKQLLSKKNIIVTRHYRKLEKILLLKKIFPHIKVIHEMHEEAFPYLFKKNLSKNKIEKLFSAVDGIVFTNKSQLDMYQIEFGELPSKYTILPNGVELEKFNKAKMKNNYVITYVGQFNAWKNIELLFQSLMMLDKKYTLRIAGGKGDDESKHYIEKLKRKYRIEDQRVDYKGYVDNSDIVSRVLDSSNVLVLPLGDNLQAKYLTSPMKLFEYMATSIPVVAVNYPSVNGIVSEQEIFLAKNDPEDFAKYIKKACAVACNDKILKMNHKVKQYTYENRSVAYNTFIQSF